MQSDLRITKAIFISSLAFLLTLATCAPPPQEPQRSILEEKQRLLEEQQRLEAEKRLALERQRREQARLRQLRRAELEVKWQSFPNESYDAALCSQYWSNAAGRSIDSEVKRLLETVADRLFIITPCEPDQKNFDLAKLSPEEVRHRYQQPVVIFGRVEEAREGYTIFVRAYSHEGSYLTSVLSATAAVQADITEKYHSLVRQVFPFSGEITDVDGRKVDIVFRGSGRLSARERENFPREFHLIQGGSGGQLEFTDTHYDTGDGRLKMTLEAGLSGVDWETPVLLVGNRTAEEGFVTLILTDQYGSCIDHQVFANPFKYDEQGYVGLTNEFGQIPLKQRNTQRIYVIVKQGGKEVARFEIPRGAELNFTKQIERPE